MLAEEHIGASGRELTMESVPMAPGAPTVVDLVADTGISIARAQRVYRFWLAHEAHHSATALRPTRDRTGTPGGIAVAEDKSLASSAAADVPGVRGSGSAYPNRSGSAAPAEAPIANPSRRLVPGIAVERRGDERIERDRLIQELRHADPLVRSNAFEKLKNRPRPG
jgi:hypothetical protein